MKKTILLLGVLVVALAVVGIIIYVRSRFETTETKSQINENVTETSATSASAVLPTLVLNQSITTASGLQITKTTEGTGTATATVGSSITVNYTGMFDNGKAFDSSTDKAFGHVAPLPLTLGVGQVIKGWDEGILGMKVGEKRHLVIPASLAYGPNGYGPIPGNATLTFDVQLVSLK
ncbi:MAG: FKBP-type peptidyl-prolyl cis-trans isomerase [bacterium]